MGVQQVRWSRFLAIALGVCGAGAVLGSASLAYSAASRKMAPPTPVVAMFDLETVFNNLEERKTREAELKSYMASLQSELDALIASAKDLDTKARTLPEGSEKAMAAAKAMEAAMQVKVKQEVSNASLESRRTGSYIELYYKVSDAVKRLAQQNNYTLVMSSDERADVPPQADAQSVQRMMQLKRVFYAAPGHDITDDIVTLLNNEFKAGAKPTP